MFIRREACHLFKLQCSQAQHVSSMLLKQITRSLWISFDMKYSFFGFANLRIRNRFSSLASYVPTDPAHWLTSCKVPGFEKLTNNLKTGSGDSE